MDTSQGMGSSFLGTDVSAPAAQPPGPGCHVAPWCQCVTSITGRVESSRDVTFSLLPTLPAAAWGEATPWAPPTACSSLTGA